VAQDWNQLHILVNCAGFTLGPRPLSEITDGDWAAIEATNLRGTFQMTRAATALMGANGSVVCVSSISGRGFRGATNAAYAATKGGIVSFVQAAALELGSKHIRINCVCPGPTRTETFDAVVRAKAATEGTTEQAADNSLVQSFNTAMGRIVDASEVASVVSFLASDDASGVTGQSINVDAGLVFD
jgi:NAD(P)-dependent dehydrogenase (short-subunit alcohol dehydrogenase family)